MTRIIFINTYPLYSRKILQYDPGKDDFFLFGMGRFIAEESYKRNYPVKFEIWRMDLRITAKMEKEINGIFCRIFPSKEYPILNEFSYDLYRELVKIKNEDNVVLHFMGVHSHQYNLYAFAARNLTIIATHLGGQNPLYKLREEKNKVSYVSYFLEKYFFLRFYDHFVSMSAVEIDYFKKMNKSAVHSPIFGIPNLYLLNIQDRTQCRKSLNLPLDKKIILQIGRANENRGFQWILEILKENNYPNNWEFVFAGIHKEDEYYNELVATGLHITGYSSTKELNLYYNAADVLIYLPNGKMDLNFAGTSYVPIEALACGTPVVATTFHHFPGSEVKEISRIPRTKDDVVPMISSLLSEKVARKYCRAIAIRYFSWDNILEMYMNLYFPSN